MNYCACRSLPEGFSWDPRRPLLRGETEEVDREGSLRLVVCTDCRQLWRLDLPPELRPYARKIVDRGSWTSVPSHQIGEATDPSSLSIVETVSGAFSACWSERRSLLVVAALPWLLSSAATAAIRAARLHLSTEVAAYSLWLGDLVISVGLLAMFGIAWHRVILRSAEYSSWIHCHEITSQHIPFFMWSAALALAYLPYSLSTVQGHLVLALALLPVFSYIEARLSVALPSTAIGESPRPLVAWELSRGYGIPLLLILLLAGVGPGLLLVPVGLILHLISPLVPFPAWVFIPVREAGSFAVAAVGVTALSLSFRRLVEMRAA